MGFILLIFILLNNWRLQLRITDGIVQCLRICWQMSGAWYFLRGNPCIFNEAAILLLCTFYHSVAVFLFFADEAGLIILARIWHASPLLILRHLLAISLPWEGSLIIFTKSGDFDFGPVVDVVVFVARHPLLIISCLRKIVLFVTIGGAFWQAAGDLIKWRRLLTHIIEFHAEFGIGFSKMALEPISIHISNLDTWLPLVQSNFGALDSFTLTVIIKCVRRRFDLNIISQVMHAKPWTSDIVWLDIQLVFVWLWRAEAERLR